MDATDYEISYRGYRVTDAEALALRLHAGQVDQGGEAYIEHLRRVAGRVFGAKRKIIALLHDSLEDTGIDEDGLAADGVPDDCIRAIVLLRHIPKRPRAHYLVALAEDDAAADVKEADMDDNSDPARIAKIDDAATRERLEAKYARDKRVLAEARAAIAQRRAGQATTGSAVRT